MTPHATPTAADALHVLLPQANPGLGPTATWPATHRVLATAAGMLLCLLAGVGCADTRSRAVPQAVVPTYSYVHDATPEVQRDLWPLVPVGADTLMAGGTPTP